MTFRHAIVGFTRTALPLLASALAHTACSGHVDGESGYGAPLRDDGSTAAGANGGGGAQKPAQKPAQNGLSQAKSAKDCADLAKDVEATLQEYCSNCHANGNRMGGFGDVLDVPKMVEQVRIVPGDSGSSKLYKLVKSGTMPKTPQKPSKDEIATLHDWIDCGAVDWNTGAPAPAGGSTFVSINDRLGAIRDDLRSFDNEADRRRMRYIDFSNLANDDLDADAMQKQRALASLLTNSLSFAKRVVEPAAVDGDKLLYRIDLRDYAWSEETWEQIVADYPYAVRYDENSPLFAYDEDAAEDIREETNTNVPYVQADWFIAHVSQPPLYYDLLRIPENVNDLLLDQGVNIEDNLRNADVVRAGFNGSGVALNNRVIERHELPGFGGALWISYDFRGNVDEQNIFANPADFRQDGGEGFFNLPNGLQAYFVVDANLRRLDKAPTDIVSDPNTRDRAVAAGLSCMGGCHLSSGINGKDDQVRDYVLATAADPDERDRALELYPENDRLHELVESDKEHYAEALSGTGIDPADDRALIDAVRTHEDVINLGTVAAVLGIKEERLNASLDASPQAFPPEIVALRVKGGSVYRATFDAVARDVIEGLGLGEQLRGGRGLRDADDDDDDEQTAREQQQQQAEEEREAAEQREQEEQAAQQDDDDNGRTRRNRR